MPIALLPDKTFPITLAVDKDQPRPMVFHFHYLTAMEWLTLTDFVDDDAQHKDKTVRQLITQLAELLAEYLDDVTPPPSAAWVPTADALLTLLSINELWELYHGVRSGSRLGTPEKNASASPSPSAPATSAPATAPRDAPASQP